MKLRKNDLCRVGVVAMVGALLLSAGAAQAQTIFATSEDTLFRIDGVNIDTFTLSQPITSLSFDDNGELWGTTNVDVDTDTNYELYKITDPFGTPGLSLVSDGLAEKTASIDWVGNTLYATQTLTSTTNAHLFTVDPNTGNETAVGATGDTSANTGGMGVDEINQVMYLADTATDELKEVDWLLNNGPEPTATAIGALNLNADTQGLDFYEPNGTLYAMFKLNTSEDIGIYTIDTGTGEATLLEDLSGLTQSRGSAAIAVIPEPATIGLFVIGAFGLLRRRR